jgi:hypothetical protein
MQTELIAYRQREKHFPCHGHVSSRLPKIYEMRLRSKALQLKSTPSELLRFLAAKGAEAYGFDMFQVL